MNKYELKYCFEEEARKNSELIDVVGTLSNHKHKRTCVNIILERIA